MLKTTPVDHTENRVICERVIFLGDATVGKTSLIQSFKSNGSSYSNDYKMTTNVDLTPKEIKMSNAFIPEMPTNDMTVDLLLIECPGQSIFNQRDWNMKVCSRKCGAMVCAFDISSRKSFQNCTEWIRAFQSEGQKVSPTPLDDLILVLVGCKADLRDETEDECKDIRCHIQADEARKYAHDEFGAEYFECSAKNRDGVDAPFEFIATQIIRHHLDSKDSKDAATS